MSTLKDLLRKKERYKETLKNYIYGVAYYSNGTQKTSRNFTDPAAFSRWANKQFRKDEQVTVYEYHYNTNDFDFKLACTWHA